jgi:hypothetical protein
MKKFKCKYGKSETVKEIRAESSEEAYKAFLDQEGIKPDYVYVSDGGLWSQTDTYEGHFEEASEKADAIKKKQVEAKQVAESSLSSTDVLLKELIKEQKQTNEWLKKVRWSLLGINVIMVLWYIFGWVIFPI